MITRAAAALLLATAASATPTLPESYFAIISAEVGTSYLPDQPLDLAAP